MESNADNEWCCWKLVPEDIKGVALKYRLEVNEEDYDEVARKVKKGIQWALDNLWMEIIKDAIRDTPPTKTCPRCGDLKPKDEFETWEGEDICMSCVTDLESQSERSALNE